jgi:hypothetical protein
LGQFGLLALVEQGIVADIAEIQTDEILVCR